MEKRRDNESAALRDEGADEQPQYGITQQPLVEADSKDGQELTEQTFLTSKILATTVILFSFITRGMAAEIMGPTMQEILQRTGTTYEGISLVMTVGQVVRLVTSVTMVLIQERIRRYSYLQGAFAMLCCMVGMCIIPRATNMLHLFMAYSSIGLGLTCISLAAHALILDIWKDRSSAPMQLLHAAYGLGALLTPETVSVFIPKTISYIPSSNNAPNECVALETDKVSNDTSIQHSYPIGNAYLTVAICSAVSAVTLIVCQALECRCDSKDGSESGSGAGSKKAVAGPSQKSQMCFVVLAVSLAAVTITPIVGSDRLYGFFATVLGLRRFCFSLKDSLSLGTAYFIALTVGRVLFAFIPFLDGLLALAIQLIGVVVGSVCLYFVGQSNLSAVLVLTIIIGFFIAPIYANIFVWINSLFYVKGSYLAILGAASAVGNLSYLSLIGFLLQQVGPRSVLALGVTSSALLGICGCLMISLSCVARRRHPSGKLLPG